MKKVIATTLMSLMTSTGCLAGHAASVQKPGVAPQMVGFWKISYNEDPLPPDTVEIRADGTFVLQGIRCAAHIEGSIHEFNGELYTRLELPGKGPISFIFKPDGRGNLVFTSSRTRNNAVYSKLPKNPCPGK